MKYTVCQKVTRNGKKAEERGGGRSVEGGCQGSCRMTFGQRSKTVRGRAGGGVC